MKNILRNFWVIIRAYSISSILSVMGLAFAFATTTVIVTYVDFQNSANDRIKDADRIFRVDFARGEHGYQCILPYQFIEMAKGAAHVQAAGRCKTSFQTNYCMTSKLSEKIESDFLFIESSLMEDVIRPEILAGDLSSLRENFKVMISRTFAEKLYGSPKLATGKTLIVNRNNITEEFEIGAVYEDFADNSYFENVIYAKNPVITPDPSWNNCAFSLFVKLDKSENTQAVEQYLLDASKDHEIGSVRLLPLKEIYYTSGSFQDNSKKGDPKENNILLAIAMVVMVIAGINFINFSLAIAPSRMKSITIHKIFGSSIFGLRLVLIGEMVLFCLLAGLISLFLIVIALNMGLMSLFDYDIAIFDNWVVVVGMMMAFLVVGAVAGLIPAIYLTRKTKVASVRSKGGIFLRNCLLFIQYGVSIVLIIVAVAMNMQRSYIQNKDLGFSSENIVTLDLGEDFGNSFKNAFNDRIKSSPLISQYSYCFNRFAGEDRVNEMYDMRGEEAISFNYHNVSAEFVDMMGIEILEGENFNENDYNPSKATRYAYLINRTCAQTYGLKPGDKLENGEIKGIIGDFNYATLNQGIGSYALVATNRYMNYVNQAYLKIPGDEKVACDYIRSVIKEFDPTMPVEILPMRATIDRLYNKERNQTMLVTLFSILSIIISLSGVVSIVLLDMRSKTREIGLRKINGAGVCRILLLFNKKFLMIAMISAIPAIVVSNYFIGEWLSQFVYKVEIGWWVYGLVLLMILVMTATVVTVCSYRIAVQDPTKALRIQE